MVIGINARIKKISTVCWVEYTPCSFTVFCCASDWYITHKELVKVSKMYPDCQYNRTILIVDVEPKHLSLMEEILTGKGFEVICKSSGKEAIKFLKERGAIAVIFADFDVGEMTGIELFKWVRINYPNTYGILLSSELEVKVLLKDLELNEILSFIRKPFKNHEIVSQAEKGVRHFNNKKLN